MTDSLTFLAFTQVFDLPFSNILMASSKQHYNFQFISKQLAFCLSVNAAFCNQFARRFDYFK